MFKSIRSILYFSFVIIGISLFLVIILGARQYQLSSRYTATTMLSERALFAFATIREQATESLIARDYNQLKKVIPAIEQLNNTVSRLYDSDVIPGEYKLAMADRIDLAGLVISLRKLDTAPDKPVAGVELQQELRHIGDSLFKVDRIITGQIRDSVVNFQLSIIGALGVLISCASFILIGLHRTAIKPLLDLSTQAHEGVEESGFRCPAEAGTEIVRFVSSANEIMARLPATRQLLSESETHDSELLSTTVNQSANRLNGIINYAQLLLESEGADQFGEEQRKMLENIIDNGERIGEQWQEISQQFSG
jgi:hypothetical protein